MTTATLVDAPRVPPWEVIGEPVSDVDPERFKVDPTVAVDEVLAAGGLSWGVLPGPVFDAAGAHVAGYSVMTRTDTGAHLGIVGSRFTPVQNHDVVTAALRLATADGHQGEARVTHAGTLKGGRRVWLVIRDAVPFTIGPGDDFYTVTFLVGNGHDGSMSLTVSLLTTRLACTNQILPALRGQNRVWSWRHTAGIAQRREEVILGQAQRYVAALRETGDDLARRRMGRMAEDTFLNRLIPYTPAMDADPGGRAARSRDEALEAIRAVHAQSPSLGDLRGTAWGMYQAVAEWADWERPVRASDPGTAREYRFARATGMSATTAAVKQRALSLLQRSTS